MKKLALVSTALLLSASAMNASALTFEFDPEIDGLFIDVDVLTTNSFPNDPVVVRQYLGVDGQLNNGDTFAEEIGYNFTTSTGSPSVIFPFPGLDFDLTLRGEISDVVYGAGIPDIAVPGTFAANLAATSFQTNFDTSAENSAVGMTISYIGTVLGEFDLVDSVQTPVVSLDGSTLNQAFIFDFQFDQVWAAANTALINSVWRQDGGDLIDPELFTIQGQGSAGPDGTSTGVAFDAGVGEFFVGVNVQDNGSTFKALEVPEPTTIAILGLGLLGLAGTRRKA